MRRVGCGTCPQGGYSIAAALGMVHVAPHRRVAGRRRNVRRVYRQVVVWIAEECVVSCNDLHVAVHICMLRICWRNMIYFAMRSPKLSDPSSSPAVSLSLKHNHERPA
jgi:hypothetical protein